MSDCLHLSRRAASRTGGISPMSEPRRVRSRDRSRSRRRFAEACLSADADAVWSTLIGRQEPWRERIGAWGAFGSGAKPVPDPGRTRHPRTRRVRPTFLGISAPNITKTPKKQGFSLRVDSAVSFCISLSFHVACQSLRNSSLFFPLRMLRSHVQASSGREFSRPPRFRAGSACATP